MALEGLLGFNENFVKSFSHKVDPKEFEVYNFKNEMCLAPPPLANVSYFFQICFLSNCYKCSVVSEISSSSNKIFICLSLVQAM